MSGRFVRQSAYRHVFGQPAKEAYQDIRPACAGDGDYVATNGTYIAFPAVGGGGPVVLLHKEQTGRQGNAKKMTVHKHRVLDCQFNPFVDTVLATASEDGTTAITAFPEFGKEGLQADVKEPTAVLKGHQKKVVSLAWHPTASNVLGTVSPDMSIRIWDVSHQAEMLQFKFENAAPWSMSWNSNGSLLACTAKNQLTIVDPRQQGAASTGPGFAGSKPAKALWADNHEKLICVGFTRSSQRQYSLWDPRNMEKSLITKDIDQSAGALLAHYDPDTSVLFVAGKGDSSVKYFEVTNEAPYIHFLSEFRDSQSQKGIGWAPKRSCDITKCEIAVALRVLRDKIQPVSFCVPRKSDMFQEDLFPDTYAGVATATHEEYFEGKDGEVKLVSMRPGEGEERVQVKMVVNKSPQELQQLLDEANAKIKALEAEVAKLKA